MASNRNIRSSSERTSSRYTLWKLGPSFLSTIRERHLKLPTFNQRTKVEVCKILCVFISAMFHNFRLGPRIFAKCQNCDLGLHLGLHLGPHLGSVRRPNLLHRNRGKRNHGAEHIALDKLRGPAGIELRVFVSIPHPGPQFVCQPDFPTASSSAFPGSRRERELPPC